jgi:hypothetical protein
MTHEIPEPTFMGRQAFEPASVFHLMSDRYTCSNSKKINSKETFLA